MAFFGTDPQVRTLPTLSPQQLQLQNAGIQQALSLLQSGALSKPFDFAPIAQRARTQFQQRTLPSIAERFTSMGEGAQSSDAFTSALGGAGANLEEALAALEAEYGFKSQGQQQNLLQLLFGLGERPAFENLVQPGSPGALGIFSQSLAQALPSMLYGFPSTLSSLFRGSR